MSDQDALFRAILDAPDDDPPRLVYADWLEETAKPANVARAEFIRLQCEQARLADYEPAFAELSSRAVELLAAHGAEWRLPLAAGVIQRYRRGFVEGLSMPAALFLLEAPELFRQTPLREVHFTGVGEHAEELLASPHLQRLAGIDLSDNFLYLPDPAVLADIHMPNLRSLTLAGLNLNAAILDVLFRAVRLPALAELDLSRNPLGIAGAEALADAPGLRGLRVLRLGVNAIIDYVDRFRAAGAAALVESPHLTQLRVLALHGQTIGDGGLRALARSPNLRGVEELDLSANDIGTIGTAGLEELFASPHAESLRVLNLSDNPLALPGVRELAVWPGLARLRRIDLSGCAIGSAGGLRLADSPHWHPQVRINLARNRIGSDAFRYLRQRLGERVLLDEPDA